MKRYHTITNSKEYAQSERVYKNISELPEVNS